MSVCTTRIARNRESEVKTHRLHQMNSPQMFTKVDLFNSLKKRVRSVCIKNYFHERLPFPTKVKIFSTGYKKLLLEPERRQSIN